MGRVIRILLAVAILGFTFNHVYAADGGSWWWSNWWGDKREQQQEQIQRRVVKKCERDMEYWGNLWAEHPDNHYYKRYYYEAKKRCEQHKKQYDDKYKK